MVVALASRFWRLGCPKIYHEVATRLLPSDAEGFAENTRFFCSTGSIRQADANSFADRSLHDDGSVVSHRRHGESVLKALP
ncbi:hypothetical protein [Thiolapillus sp.]|uniref:hypothetical protein n=1 Tax=Thiolapillus sp. TaxID=2017437 RepID=UPI003AF85B9B